MKCWIDVRLRGDEGWYSVDFGSTPEDLPEGEVVIAGLRGNCSIDDAKMIDMFHSTGMLQYVETLEIRGSWENPNEGLTLFSRLESLRELDIELDLDRNGLNVIDSGVRCLERLSRLERLTLCFEGTGDGAISSIQKLPLLTNLGLSFTKVTDKGVQELAGLAQLQVLDLCGSAITDSGLTHLRTKGGLQKLPLLTNLDLSFTKVTDKGVQELAVLARLQVLDLSRTAITDSGLAHLKAIRGLQKLDLHNTEITENGIKDLKNALPDCVIHK